MDNAAQNREAVKPSQQPKDPRFVITPKCRLNYAHVFAPRAVKPGDEPAYSVTLVFEPGTDLTPMKRAAYVATTEKWGDKRPKTLKNPFHSCSDRENQEGFTPGGTYITARTKNKPQIVDQAKRPILTNDALYSGCYVRVSLRAFAFDRPDSKGVSFALLNIQKMSDGDRLDNRRTADQDFDPLPGAEDDMFGANGKGPLDDDLPF